jgi:hypothetical protein
MKPFIILPTERLSFGAAASIFCGVFGSLWLFLEPLEFFGLAPKISIWVGLFGYSLLLIISFVSVLIYSKINSMLRASRYEFITFTIISATEGSEYAVKAPKHMQVVVFLHKFIFHLSTGPAKSNIDLLNIYFYPVFQIQKEQGYIDVNSQSTLSQAGIVNGSLCQIRANPKSESNEIKYRFA